MESILAKKGRSITPADLKSLAVTYAILTDKRRLEENADAQADEALTPERIYEDGKLQLMRMRNGTQGGARAALVSDVEAEGHARNGHGG